MAQPDHSFQHHKGTEELTLELREEPWLVQVGDLLLKISIDDGEVFVGPEDLALDAFDAPDAGDG